MPPAFYAEFDGLISVFKKMGGKSLLLPPPVPGLS
jgi:hypothetical protein